MTSPGGLKAFRRSNPPKTKRSGRPEAVVKRRIELDLGSEPDLLLMVNNQGLAKHYDDNGKEWSVPYGLGKGTPDLVGILRVIVRTGPPSGAMPSACVGVWIAWEVKAPGKKAEEHQEASHRAWASFGAFVATVDNVAAARAHLETVRRIFR